MNNVKPIINRRKKREFEDRLIKLVAITLVYLTGIGLLIWAIIANDFWLWLLLVPLAFVFSTFFPVLWIKTLKRSLTSNDLINVILMIFGTIVMPFVIVIEFVRLKQDYDDYKVTLQE
ncbi:MAG: hypothetical protein WC399_00075 [Bacilli bacterium]|jgi:fucose permease